MQTKNRQTKITGFLARPLLAAAILIGASIVMPEASAIPAAPGAARAPGRIAARWSVCVYCGASDGKDPRYLATAERVGEGLARRRWTLVWGGGQSGLMGAVSRGAKEAGGHVVGIIPEFIRAWEVEYADADEMMVVTTMHERKALLQARADAFVVLPGGLGTLDELADTLDLRQLDRHQKPIVVLNENGYYDRLLEFLDRSVAEGFSREAKRRQLLVARDLEEFWRILEELESRKGSMAHAGSK